MSEYEQGFVDGLKAAARACRVSEAGAGLTVSEIAWDSLRDGFATMIEGLPSGPKRGSVLRLVKS